MEQELLEAGRLFNVTDEVTVSVTLVLIDKLAFAPVKVIEAHVALISQVRLTVFGITTGSFGAGTPAGVQVPEELQFPVMAVLIV